MIQKKISKTILKILLSVLGLYLAYKNIPLETLSKHIEIKFMLVILLGVLLNMINIFIYSIRLNIVTNRPSRELFDTYIVSLKAIYFNMFLPSTIGGDSYKVTQLKNKGNTYQETITNVVLDRIYGVTSIVIISFLAVLYLYYKNVQLQQFVVLSVWFFSLLILGIWLFIFNNSKFLFLKNIRILKRNFNFEKIFDRLERLRKQTHKSQLLLLVLSFCTQIVNSIIILIGIKYLGLNISFIEALLYSSISALLLMLPISIGGVGARDYIYKNFYGFATGSPDAILLAPFILIVTIITSIIGGILFLFGNSKDI